MIPKIRNISLIKNRLTKVSLFLFVLFINLSASAYLPNGKMKNFSFKEQSNQFNYEISGSIGYVSHLNNIFSAQAATIKIYNQKVTTDSLTPIKVIYCDEITYELSNTYLVCIQSEKYLSIDLKTDKISN